MCWMIFDASPGNESAKTMLSAALTGSGGHAWLIVGPEAISRERLAVTFARALFCETADACGHCSMCRRFDNVSLLDFHRVEPEKGSIKIAQVRKLIAQAAIAPLERKGLVFYISQADKMNETAQNAFLKLLEEPPLGTVMILTASGKEALLPTLISRCNCVAVAPEAQTGLTPEQFDFRNEALSWWKQIETGNYLLLEEIKRFEKMKLTEGLLDGFLGQLQSGFRDMMRCSLGYAGIINTDIADKIEYTAGRFVPDEFLRKLDVIERFREDVRINVNFKVAVENLCFGLPERL